MIFKLINFKNIFYILSFGLIFIFFIYSLYLNTINYDPRHNGLVYIYADYIKNNFFSFPQIYFMYGLLNAYLDFFSLIFFGDNVFSIILLTNIFFYLALVVFFFYSLKFFKAQNSFLLILVLICCHPIVIYGWHSYKSFFFILASTILLSNHKPKYIFIGGLFLSLYGFLYNINAFVGFFCYLFFLLRLFIYSNKKNIIYLTLSYLLPIVVFICLLYFSKNYNNWLNNLQANFLFGKITSGGTVNLIINFIKNMFLEIPKTKIIFLNSYLIFLIVFTFNTLYSIFNFLKFVKGNIVDKKEREIYSLSTISIITSLAALHSLEIFRLLPSLSMGLLVLIYILIKNKQKTLILAFILYGISSLIFPYLSSSEQVYKNVVKIQNEEMIVDHKIDILTNFTLRKSIVNSYREYNKFLNVVQKNCNFESFSNAQDKNFYLYILTNKYFKNTDRFFWQNSIDQWEKMVNKIYNIDLNQKKDLIIVNENMKSKFLNHYEAYKFVDFKNKFVILLPNSCLL